MKMLAILSCLAVVFGLLIDRSVAQESESPAAVAFDIKSYDGLVKAAKWDEAAALLDEAIKGSPDSSTLMSLSLQLAMRTTRVQPAASAERLSGLIDKWCASNDLTIESARNLSTATSMLGPMLVQQNKVDEGIDLVKRTLAAVTAKGEALRSIRRDLEANLSRQLVRSEKGAEAIAIMRSSVEGVKAAVAEGTDGLAELVKVTNNFAGMFEDDNPDEVRDRNKFVENLLIQNLESNSSQLADLSAYVSFRFAQLSKYTYSDPARGIAIANELQTRLDAFPVPAEAIDVKQLETFGKTLKSLLARLESSMARERLVGTKAPEFEPQSFVGMEETTLAGLKGKVVLLDFWAVWCGPCIATFPHLRDWHDAYSDKGLAILGMTSDQGYVWDEEKQRAVPGKDVSHEAELEMLASFRKHYELRHGFVLTPKGGAYNKQLAVSGIPQAVLLDKQGVIRMIKVGSGEKNAKDLEQAIAKLLAE